MATWKWYILPLQNIIRVVPQDKPTVDITKSSRQNDRCNKQHWGSHSRLTDSNTFQNRRRTDEIISDWVRSTDQWKYGICGIKPRSRTVQTPHANNYRWVLNGTDGLRIFATAKPWQLTPEYRDRLIASAWNQKDPTKSITFRRCTAMYRTIKKQIVAAV